MDFFLNEPTTSDLRPIKLHSDLQNDREHLQKMKTLSRKFKMHYQQFDMNTEIFQ